ncbi:HSP20-like chaperone [Dentipellis sp. KUC8613]|nr:HSP20-like chaperone [Dentipellis sp. KUC8613]
MSLSRIFYEPFYTLADFDNLFDEAFTARSGNEVQRRGGRSTPATTGLIRPKMDLHENPDANTLTATFELPGLKKEDVNIEVHNNALTVSGETNVSSERKEDGYAVRERRSGKFSRTLPLPQGTKPEEIKASMENGVLEVIFPRTTPEQEAKRITIS